MALFELAWYELPADLQRMILTAIHNAQKGPRFTIGPFETLHYQTMTLVRILL